MDSKVFRWFRNDVKVTPLRNSNSTPTKLDSTISENDKDSEDSRKNDDGLPSPDSNSVSEQWEEAYDGVTKSSETCVSALDISANDVSDLSVNLSFVKSPPSLISPKKLTGDANDCSESISDKPIVTDSNVSHAETVSPEVLNCTLSHSNSFENGEINERRCDFTNGINGIGSSDDVCLNVSVQESTMKQLPHCEVEITNGSDSGVETNGKYFKETEIEASCNSSQISRSSSPYLFDSEELLSSCSAANSQTLHFSDTQTSLDYVYGEGTSEAGSESSCVTGSGSLNDGKISSRKKVGIDKQAANRVRLLSTSSTSPRETSRRHIYFSTTATKNLVGRQRELSESRSKSTRSLSSCRSKVVPAVDDGRWPSSANKSHNVTLSRQKSSAPTVSRKSPNSSTGSASESKANSQIIEKYATLPRRRRQKSSENLAPSHESSLKPRDPSLNKTEILRRKHREVNLMTSSLTSHCKSLPPYPGIKPKSKTKIYQESGSQTLFTQSDLEQLMAGNPVTINMNQAETNDFTSQVDLRNDQVEMLQTLVKQLKEDLSKSESENVSQKQDLSRTKRELESSKLMADMIQQQFKAYEDRVCNLLLKKGDYLTELERQSIWMSDLVKKQQAELKCLHHSCSKLQKELDKNSVAQKSMLQSQQELELESLEMQDFLQTEKLALADSIKELENEVLKQKQLVIEKDKELMRQKEESLQLAQIAEQRRQENVALQSKVSASEQRSKAFLLEQGASVSGASVALSGLGDRLESLIEQLVVAYNISEADLEEIVYHNEAYSRSCSNSNSDASCKILSPQDGGKIDGNYGSKNVTPPVVKNSSISHSQPSNQLSKTDPINQSFKNTNSSLQHSDEVKTNEKSSDEKLSNRQDDNSFETENLVPYDNSVPDSLLSNYENLSSDLQSIGCKSFPNLSDGMLCHQQLDKICFEEDDMDEEDKTYYEFYANHSLVDQAIEIDNLVAKLLKIFTILQEKHDNDNSEQVMSAILQSTDGKVSSTKVSCILDQLKQLKTRLHPQHPTNKSQMNGDCELSQVSEKLAIVGQSTVLKKIESNLEDLSLDDCHRTSSNADSTSTAYYPSSSSMNGSS